MWNYFFSLWELAIAFTSFTMSRQRAFSHSEIQPVLLWLPFPRAKKEGWKKITCKELGNRVWKVSAIQEILPAGFNYRLQLNHHHPPFFFFELQTYNNMTFIECASVAALVTVKSLENRVVYNQLLKYTLYTRLTRDLWRKRILSVCVRKDHLLREEPSQAAESGAGDLLGSQRCAGSNAPCSLPSHILGAICLLQPTQTPSLLSSLHRQGLQQDPLTFGINWAFSP